VLPERPTMRWNTGTGFLVLGLTLLVSTRSKRTRRTQIMCVAATTIAILGGLFTFSGHVFHADLRLDQMVLLVASVWVLAFVLDRSGTEKAAPQDAEARFSKARREGQSFPGATACQPNEGATRLVWTFGHPHPVLRVHRLLEKTSRLTKQDFCSHLYRVNFEVNI
jgi:hypothetical protein